MNGNHYNTVHYIDERARADWTERVSAMRVHAEAETAGAAARGAAPESPATAVGSPTVREATAAREDADIAMSAVARAPAPASPPSNPAAVPQAPSVLTAGVRSVARRVNGMCAPTAIAHGLASLSSTARLVRTPEAVQREVTGSVTPRAWLPADFIAAARLYRVALVFTRRGWENQTICVGPAAETWSVERIFITIESERHVVATPLYQLSCDANHLSRSPRQYVDIGADGDAWARPDPQTGRPALVILRNVRAESGDPGDLGGDAGVHNEAPASRYMASGYCGARAFAKLTGGKVGDIQEMVCGADQPESWNYADLLTAAYNLHFDGVDVRREGFPTVRSRFRGRTGTRVAIVAVDPSGTHVCPRGCPSRPPIPTSRSS